LKKAFIEKFIRKARSVQDLTRLKIHQILNMTDIFTFGVTLRKLLDHENSDKEEEGKKLLKEKTQAGLGLPLGD
jgi:hypothetical protein